MVADAYNDLTEEQKETYIPRVQADQERYRREMEAWNEKQKSEESEDSSEESDEVENAGEDAGAVVEEVKAKATKKKKKDPTKPKGAKNAYNFFVMEQQAIFKEKHPEAKSSEIVSLSLQRMRAHSVFLFTNLKSLTSILIFFPRIA